MKKLLLISMLMFACNLSATPVTGLVNVVTDCGVSNTGQDTSTELKVCLETLGYNAAVYFPPGSYVAHEPIEISGNSVNLYTDTYGVARIDYDGCDTLFTFTKNTATIFNSGVKNLWLRGLGTCDKTALEILDGSQFTVDSMKIENFSIGVVGKGRELLHIRKTFIKADQPIILGNNPNYATLDSDHTRIESVYTIVTDPTGYHIKVENGTRLSSLLIDGQNAMSKGCGILKWKSTVSAGSVSSHVKIANVRFEQASLGCDKHINIDLAESNALYGLIIENVRMEVKQESGMTAISLDNVKDVILDTVSYINNTESTLLKESGADVVQFDNLFVYPNIDINSPLPYVLGPFRAKNCCAPNGDKSLVSGKMM